MLAAQEDHDTTFSNINHCLMYYLFVKQTANHLVRHQPQLQGKGCSSSDFILGDLFSPVSEFVEEFSEPL